MATPGHYASAWLLLLQLQEEEFADKSRLNSQFLLLSHYVQLRRNFKLIKSISGEGNTRRVSLTWCSYGRERLSVFTAEWKAVHVLRHSLLIFHCTGCCHGVAWWEISSLEMSFAAPKWICTTKPLDFWATCCPAFCLLPRNCLYSHSTTWHKRQELHLASFQARNW